MLRGFCSRVGGVRRCWGITLAPLTSLQSLSHIHPPTLSTHPCQPVIHLVPWWSVLMASEQKGQYFFFCLLYFFPTIEHEDAGFIKRGASKNERHIAILRHQLVSLNFHTSHTHRHVVKDDTQLYIFSKHPILPPLSWLWWNRSCHAVTVCGRRTNKCFSLRRCDLNGKATWQFGSERPHNQTAHPQLYTSVSGQEAFRSPCRACKTHSARLFPPSENPFTCLVVLVSTLK